VVGVYCWYLCIINYNKKTGIMHAQAVANKWAIDLAHSEINFKVKHLMISTVTGKFTEFTATVESENDDFQDAYITFEAQTASVTTRNEHRDEHLRSADFFDAEQHPTMRFTSTGFKQIKGSEYELNGNLTIRGITHPVTLAVEYNGTHKDPWGMIKAGFEMSGKINRTDFGLKWNAITEAGGLTVSEEVKIEAFIELTKQAA
jgi:polyisoprenoid-binding protein YceI